MKYMYYVYNILDWWWKWHEKGSNCWWSGEKHRGVNTNSLKKSHLQTSWTCIYRIMKSQFGLCHWMSCTRRNQLCKYELLGLRLYMYILTVLLKVLCVVLKALFLDMSIKLSNVIQGVLKHYFLKYMCIYMYVIYVQ